MRIQYDVCTGTFFTIYSYEIPTAMLSPQSSNARAPAGLCECEPLVFRSTVGSTSAADSLFFFFFGHAPFNDGVTPRDVHFTRTTSPSPF